MGPTRGDRGLRTGVSILVVGGGSFQTCLFGVCGASLLKIFDGFLGMEMEEFWGERFGEFWLWGRVKMDMEEYPFEEKERERKEREVFLVRELKRWKFERVERGMKMGNEDKRESGSVAGKMILSCRVAPTKYFYKGTFESGVSVYVLALAVLSSG